MLQRLPILLLFALSLLTAASPSAYFLDHRDSAAPEIRFIHRLPSGILGLGVSRVYLAPAQPAAGAAMMISFPGSRAVHPVPEHRLAARTHLLRGADPRGWQTNLANYEAVRYPRLYPGVDLVFHARSALLEYDFELAPYADAARLRLHFAHASPRLTPAGELVLAAVGGDVIQRPPVAYQVIAGRRVPVAARWQLSGQTASFALGHYDRAYPLVLDPVITYSTFLGGDRADAPYNAVLDAANNLYVAGATTSTNFLTTAGVVQATSKGSTDGFIAKFAPDGRLLFSTLIGGGGVDNIYSVAVNAQGLIGFGGVTSSPDFPLRNALQTQFRGGGPFVSDAVVGVLDPSGASFVYSTYWGGNLEDRAQRVAIDAAGSVYAAGYTYSRDFVATSLQRSIGNTNFTGFLTKFSPSGNAPIYSTYFGGGTAEIIQTVLVDSRGAAYIGGVTASNDLPVSANAFQRTFRGGIEFQGDGFIAKVNPAGTALEFCSYFGGGGADAIRSLALDREGNIYGVGDTTSGNLPVTPGVLQPERGGNTDGFVMKASPNADTLLAATYVGGPGFDALDDVHVGPDGSVFVAGRAESANLAVRNPVQRNFGGGRDGYYAQLNPEITAIRNASFVGGPGLEEIIASPVDSTGAVHLVGGTSSPEFPLSANPAQARYGGGQFDVFVTKISDPDAIGPLTIGPARLAFAAAPAAAPLRQTLTVRPTLGQPDWTIAVATATGGNWLSATPLAGRTTGDITVTATPGTLAAGVYTGSLTITNIPLATRTVVPVTLTLSPPLPAVSANGVVNAATFRAGPLSPGQIVTLFGANLGPASLVGGSFGADGRFTSERAGVRVLFDDVPAPLIYVSATQTSAIVPYAVASRPTTQMTIEYQGNRSAPLPLPVAATQPGLFTANSSGQGPGAILNQSGTVNSANTPARPGEIIVLYGTGEGLTDPPAADGALSGASRIVAPVSVRIGGETADILYAGSAPGLVAGVMQINVRVPAGLASGAQPVLVTVGSATSVSGVTVAIDRN
jgi:uncharacterized protein (TIGR03437 family)